MSESFLELAALGVRLDLFDLLGELEEQNVIAGVAEARLLAAAAHRSVVYDGEGRGAEPLRAAKPVCAGGVAAMS